MKKNRTFSSLKPISSLLPDNVKKLIKNRPIGNFENIKNSWTNIVGVKLSEKCKPSKIQKYNGENSIFLKVERQNLIDVDYSRDEIAKKLNSYFGFQFINKVLINIEDNKSPQVKKKELNLSKKLKNLIDSIQDKDLKSKLKKLGKND